MSNYVTVGAMKEFKADGCLVITPNKYSDNEIQATLDLVEAIIETVTGDFFYSTSATQVFDGTGTHHLYFAPRYPHKLLTLTSVKELDFDGSTVLDTLTEGIDFIRYDRHLEISRVFPGDSPRRGVMRGGVWPKGQLNIQVAGTWGWTDTPEEITQATKLLTAEKLFPGSTNMNSGDVKQAMWSDFQVIYKGDTSEDGLGKDTGFVEVDRLLQNFVNYSSMFMLPDD